jgi:hypothetical protein
VEAHFSKREKWSTPSVFDVGEESGADRGHPPSDLIDDVITMMLGK